MKASRDTRTAEIQVVGEGHTILTAKVKDKAGHTSTAQIEIRNLAPRVNVSKVTVNPAYDFDSEEGKRLACENNGAVEVVPVYEILKMNHIRLWKSDKRRWRLIWSLSNMKKAENTAILYVRLTLWKRKSMTVIWV